MSHYLPDNSIILGLTDCSNLLGRLRCGGGSITPPDRFGPVTGTPAKYSLSGTGKAQQMGIGKSGRLRMRKY